MNTTLLSLRWHDQTAIIFRCTLVQVYGTRALCILAAFLQECCHCTSCFIHQGLALTPTKRTCGLRSGIAPPEKRCHSLSKSSHAAGAKMGIQRLRSFCWNFCRRRISIKITYLMKPRTERHQQMAAAGSAAKKGACSLIWQDSKQDFVQKCLPHREALSISNILKFMSPIEAKLVPNSYLTHAG